MLPGYGHIAPTTILGKLLTMVYTIIGIPLFLLYISSIGDIMATSFKWTYSRCCKFRMRRKNRKQRESVVSRSVAAGATDAGSNFGGDGLSNGGDGLSNLSGGGENRGPALNTGFRPQLMPPDKEEDAEGEDDDEESKSSSGSTSSNGSSSASTGSGSKSERTSDGSASSSPSLSSASGSGDRSSNGSERSTESVSRRSGSSSRSSTPAGQLEPSRQVGRTPFHELISKIILNVRPQVAVDSDSLDGSLDEGGGRHGVMRATFCIDYDGRPDASSADRDVDDYYDDENGDEESCGSLFSLPEICLCKHFYIRA